MIRINLLPVEEKKRRRARRTREPGLPSAAREGVSFISIIIVVICFAIVGTLGYVIYKQKITSERELQQRKGDIARYKENIQSIQDKYTEIKELLEITTNQIEVLKALDPPNRLLWSEKLNMLAELVPDGIYLTQIQVTEQINEVPTKESQSRHQEWVRKGKQGPQPQVVKKPIITQNLYLYGISRADTPEDRLRLISSFNEALRTFEWKTRDDTVHSFYEHFSGEIDTRELVVTRVERIPVTKFTFIIRTKSFSS